MHLSSSALLTLCLEEAFVVNDLKDPSAQLPLAWRPLTTEDSFWPVWAEIARPFSREFTTIKRCEWLLERLLKR